MKAKGLNKRQKAHPQYGIPLLEVFKNNCGACLFTAKANKVREAATTSPQAEENADIKTIALMKCGMPLIPASFIAMTKGEDSAPPAEEVIDGWLEGMIRVRQKIVRIIKAETL
ncbi:hypothetical protein WICPIJ_002337 [Wickerhamomyces pijperi]|uniref:Uncharacterized protein n=1 Tax=Wickerhamomyces pijperi TaxID=599730 RepID=A0A9P8Q9C9_WICPI|nr:hypothetical protein WICPIJ_002337 [Wickerhamomyces pijperi]